MSNPILIYLDTNVYSRSFDDQTQANIQDETLERGKGNTIEDIIKYWGTMNIEEIHYQVVAWKKQMKTA